MGRSRDLASNERGFMMAALLVTLSVMAVLMGALVPVWSTAARREREEELVFRGEQYARAIMLFQRKYANARPPSVDVLLSERFLRKKYKDPITNEDFELLAAGVGAFNWVFYDFDVVMTAGSPAHVAARFPAYGSEDFFVSGFARGESELGGTAAVVDEPVGGGRVVPGPDPHTPR